MTDLLPDDLLADHMACPQIALPDDIEPPE